MENEVKNLPKIDSIKVSFSSLIEALELSTWLEIKGIRLNYDGLGKYEWFTKKEDPYWLYIHTPIGESNSYMSEIRKCEDMKGIPNHVTEDEFKRIITELSKITQHWSWADMYKY